MASVLVHGGLAGTWGGDLPRLRWGQKADGVHAPRAPHLRAGRAALREPQAVAVSARLLAQPHPEPGPAPHVRGAASKPLEDGPSDVFAERSGPANESMAASPFPPEAGAAFSGPPPSAISGASPNAVSPNTAPEGHQRSALPTRIPADFVQSLVVSRGSQTGEGQWSWSVTGGRYRSELMAQLTHPRPDPRAQRSPPGPQADATPRNAAAALNWSSAGGLDPYGVAPERFLTQPAKGGARAVNFQRDTGRVTFSGPTGQAALVPGAQDRLSWLAQLLALAQAHPEGRGLPTELPLWVAGPQGDGGDWWFAVQWNPATACWQFSRRAERRYDVQVQAWVAVGSTAQLIRLEMGPEGGRQAPWLLRDAQRPQACGHPP